MALVVMGVAAASAYAASYTWVNGDTLQGYEVRPSGTCRNAVTSYGHRLSGPASDPMTVAAYRSSNCKPYTLYCQSAVNGDEAYCVLPGTFAVNGVLTNADNNAHPFNAHLTY